QSTIDNNDLKRLGSTPSDVGTNSEASDLLCLVLGLLVVVPSVVPANAPSWLSSCCGVEFLPAMPENEGLG
ncbi:hypothetical protein DSO57_1009653, partial [Entomophthora muscae]